MKICVVCITYNRPALLARVIECFQRQTHQDREMIILDDANQFTQQSGDRWCIVPVQKRFLSCGEKINAAAAMASKDTEAYAKWDDDDVYLPYTLAAQSKALEKGGWSQCRQILEFDKAGGYIRQYTFHSRWPKSFAYHGSWAYRRDLFAKVRGYPFKQDEEYDMTVNCQKESGPSIDPISSEFPLPFYVYDRKSNPIHFSAAGCNQNAYDQRGKEEVIPCPVIVPAWDRDYDKIPIPSQIKERPW